MRHRTTFVLLTLFLTGLCVLWWADYADIPTREDRARILDRLLPELIDTPPADVRRVEVDHGTGAGAGKERIVVERQGDGLWQMRAPVDTAADPTLIETLVRNLKNLRKSSDAGTIVSDPATYGLAPPSTTLKVFVKGRKEPLATLDIGRTDKDRGYVRPGGGPGIEVVDTRLLGAVTQGAVHWRDRSLFRVPSFRIQKVMVGVEAPPLRVTLQRGERRWRIVDPIRVPADDDKAEGLVAELAALTVADEDEGFEKDDVRDLAPFGLDKPAMTLAVSTAAGSGPTEVVSFGNGVPGKEGQVYAVRGRQDDVVRVDVKRLREALPGLNGLRSLKVLDFDPRRVDRLKIDARGKVFDLARRRNGWALLGPVREPADARSVQSLLTALAELKSSEFLDPARVAAPRLEKPAFRVRGWQPADADESGTPPPPDPASAGEPTRAPRFDLTLGRHDVLKKSIFGRIAGDTSVLALPESILEQLPRTDFAFRNRTVLELKPADVARITVERRRSTVTVEAPGAGGLPGRWRMTEPVKAAADDAAVTALVVTLSRLVAESWESDRVGDGKAFGLDAPRLRVKWTLQPGPVSVAAARGGGVKGTLRVGKVKPGASAFYANIEGEPQVFALDQGVIKPLEAELHGSAVMAFKPETAGELVLRWPSRSLALVKGPRGPGAGPEWQSPPGYDTTGFDASRVGALVAAMANLKTPRFLQYSGPITDGFGLAHPRVALTVRVAGKGAPPTLRVGNSLTPDAFAATTAEGDEGPVFVLPVNEVWKDALQTPARNGDLPENVFTPDPPAARGPG